MNGRFRGDSLGRLTFHDKSGVSVADYAICDQDLFHSIYPIITWHNIYTVNNHLATENTNDAKIYNSTANKSHTENDT